MYRGTTPTFTFTLPFDCAQISLLNLCFAQQGQIVLEKDLSACTAEGSALRVKLKEEETLLFQAQKGMVEIQLRIGCGKDRMVSKVMLVSVGDILKDGCLE